MHVNQLIERVDELLSMGQEVLATRRRNDYGEWIDPALMSGFRGAALSFIERVYGNSHPHFVEFRDNAGGQWPADAEKGVGILRAVRSEIAGGWLFSIKGLVTAEVFSDFLEMAEHLLETGYKDPAAVVCGSVLEEHLRQLARKNGIETETQKDGKDVPKKADSLNSELARSDVYSKLDQKMITGWLDLRNKAAHGKYDEYSEDQVRHLIMSATEFMARVSI